MQSCKLTRPNTPAEVALCFEPRANIVTGIRHPNMRIRRWRPAHTADRCEYATDAGLTSDGRGSEPRSHHIAGLLDVECEGLGAICTSQKTHGRPNRTGYGKIGAG